MNLLIDKCRGAHCFKALLQRYTVSVKLYICSIFYSIIFIFFPSNVPHVHVFLDLMKCFLGEKLFIDQQLICGYAAHFHVECWGSHLGLCQICFDLTCILTCTKSRFTLKLFPNIRETLPRSFTGFVREIRALQHIMPHLLSKFS